jgi:hypothetical protein
VRESKVGERGRLVKNDSARHKRWEIVANAEIAKWSELSYEQLVSALSSVHCYEVEYEQIRHQIEVEIILLTPECVHVALSADDGCMSSVTRGFVRHKSGGGEVPQNGGEPTSLT